MKRFNIPLLFVMLVSMITVDMQAAERVFGYNRTQILEEEPNFSADVYYRIITKNGDSRCVDIAGGEASNGGKICIWSNIPTRTSEDWIVKKVDNHYQILTRDGEFAINDPTVGAATPTTNTGTQLNLAIADMTSQSQLWDIVPQSDGYFNIINVHTQHTMNINGGTNADGTALISYKSDSGNSTSKNRQWRFEISDPDNNQQEDTDTYYSLTIIAKGNGTVSKGDDSINNKTSVYKVSKGTSSIITITPNVGYYIKSVTLNDVDVTANVTNGQYIINNMFEDMTLIVEFEYMSSFVVKTIEGVNMRFSIVSTSAKTVMVGNSDPTSNGLTIDKTFVGKLSIPSSVIYNNVEYRTISIGDGAFLGCEGLTSIEIPSSVTSIGNGAFYGCRGLGSIEIPNSVASIYKDTFGGCTGMTSVTIGNSVTSIGENAFWDCRKLTSIKIPNSVTSIDNGAFSGCKKLNNLTIEDGENILSFHTSNTTISGFSDCTVFKNCPIETLYIGRNVLCSNSSPFKDMSTLKDVTIGNSVTSVSENAFYGCTGMTSVTIGNSVTNIDKNAFHGCAGLTSIKIPNSVTSIGESAFYQCSGLTSIIFGNNVKIIGDQAFMGCKGLTAIHIADIAAWCKITFNDNTNANTHTSNPLAFAHHLFINGEEIKDLIIPDNVTNIGYAAFYQCFGLTSVEIPSSVTSIGNAAFYQCSGLKSVEIHNSVTSIGYSAFYQCIGLKSVEIPNSVTSISSNVFSGCPNLESVSINSNAIVAKNYTPSSLGLVEIFGNQVKEYVIGEDVKSIGSYAFCDCTGMTSIKIPNSVTSIGNNAFYGCTGLTSIEIPNSVTRIDNNAFSSCSSLASINLPSGIEKIGNYVFTGCVGLERVEIHVPSIGSWFSELASLKEVLLGDEVTSIGAKAFSGCSNLTSISLPDNIIEIGNNAFPKVANLYVNKGTATLLTIWNKGMISYNKQTEKELLAPTISVDATTQTTATIKILNSDIKDGYTYRLNNEVINDTIIIYSGIKQESTQQLKLVVSLDDIHYDVTGRYTTKGMNTKVDDNYKVTASSIRATGSYTEEDAKVVAQRMIINGKSVEGNECFASGLNPGRSYTVVNEIDVDYGGETIETYSASRSISPARLQFSIAQPKVISEGNAIVSATVNLDPDEENVGFEWRRTDWTNEFPSNTGQAYLYEGVIEGYIKNLNTDKLWKFRPYYLSDDGTYHYGDWMGLDPTNTSYFEPTVHTYAKISIEGNTALVRGYALAGTDKIKVQGFKYWKTSNNAPHRALVVPSDAKTIEAIGQQIITATLAALDYNSTYHYVAFVTTEDGTTYYGEEQVFKTPEGNSTVKDDVNEDGVVDTQDVLAIYKYMQQSDGSAVPGKYDVNGDGIVDTQDVLEIYKYIQEH